MGNTIDIMLPYYGDFGMLQAAVDSVLQQSDPDFKLTIINDMPATEKLSQYFFGLVESDRRIAFVQNETNLGANASYRKCVSLITHDFVVIMGADDVMLPNYIAVIKNVFTNSQIDIVQPGVEVIDEAGVAFLPLEDKIKNKIRKKVMGKSGLAVFSGEKIVQKFMFGNFLYFPALAWRATAIKKYSFRENYHVVQDLALVLDILCDSGKIALTDTVCFQYRRHRNSDSALKALDGFRFREDREFFAEFQQIFRQKNWDKAARAAKFRVTSRLHALALLPKAIRAKKWGGVKQLLLHMGKF